MITETNSENMYQAMKAKLANVVPDVELKIKADVAASYAEEDSWPSSLSDMGYSEPISGKYVSEILVEDGAISIHYGAGANQILSGEVLTLRPSISREGEVVWSCGHAGSPGTDPRSGPSGLDGTSVPAKYLPVTCRGRCVVLPRFSAAPTGSQSLRPQWRTAGRTSGAGYSGATP